MQFRHSKLFALATFIAVSAVVPAMADDWQSGGVPLGGVTGNTLTASNTAAGIGNVATQDIHATQGGAQFGSPRRLLGMGGFGPSMGGPLVTTNTTVGTNVAAGIGNEADQSLRTGQSGAGFGLVNNGVNGLNLAAGIGNLATQSINARQK